VIIRDRSALGQSFRAHAFVASKNWSAAYPRVWFIATLDPKSYGGAGRGRTCCDERLHAVTLLQPFGQYLSLGRSLVAVCSRLEVMPVMTDFVNYSATETLRDGRTVEIRAQSSQDREAMHAAIARSSSRALYRRFFAVRREFSEKETDYFLDIDFVNHVALVAVANEAGQPTMSSAGGTFSSSPVRPKSRSRSSTHIMA
jgi:hypothetical protein